jgi:hypothetical protein
MHLTKAHYPLGPTKCMLGMWPYQVPSRKKQRLKFSSYSAISLLPYRISITMDVPTIEIEERDDAGNLSATYVESASPSPSKSSSRRVDVIVSLPFFGLQPATYAECRCRCIQLPKNTHGRWTRLINVFLPAGYPNSVTDDYLEFDLPPRPVRDSLCGR